MKAFKIFTICALTAVVLASCVTSPKINPQPEGITKGDVDSVSFTIGVYLGKLATNSDLGDLNLSQIMKGYVAAVNDPEDALYDQTFINDGMQNFMQKRQQYLALENLNKGTEFLAKMEKEEGVVKTESGLLYKVIEPGNDNKPVADGDIVTVNYEGKTIDGKVFDTTFEEGSEPISFPLDRVIPGWTEGMKFVGEGGEIMLYIPAELGYGLNGPMGPQQTLIFKVDLIEVEHVETSVAE